MVCVWLVGEEGDIAIGVLVDDLCARGTGKPQSFQACRDATVGADFDRGTDAPYVSPPRAARCRTQDVLLGLLGPAGGGIRGAADFPVDFLGIAMVSRSLAASGVVMASAAKSAGNRPCQY